MVTRENVVTLDRVDGFRIVTELGYAHGEATRPRDVVRSTFRSIGAFIGLAPIEYLTDAERAREESLDRMRGHAETMGANGIINVQFQTFEGAEGTKVMCYGQAVILEERQT
ncbi:MAG: heavy metal-binding domain-containing protein [Candidatus Eremiobacteraeota bacterium]|nr:heavy metal-binding domain-containing protein [Candidatus Eremiobacteraeota bacterium]